MKKKPAQRTLKQARADVMRSGKKFRESIRQMNEDVEPKCEACGKPYAIHKGITGTCLQLQDALQQLAHIYSLVAKALYAHNPGKDCPRCRLLHKDIAQLSRREA